MIMIMIITVMIIVVMIIMVMIVMVMIVMVIIIMIMDIVIMVIMIMIVMTMILKLLPFVPLLCYSHPKTSRHATLPLEIIIDIRAPSLLRVPSTSITLFRLPSYCYGGPPVEWF